MKKLWSVLGMLVVVLAVYLIIYFIGLRVSSVHDRFSIGENPLLRFIFVGIALLIAFAIYLATRSNKAWEVGTRQVVWMAIGAALYAVFSWLFNSSVFLVPSVSQVALRPAICIPMFFGFTFGPVVGFFTGAVGNMFGDALTGFGLSPQWSAANGLIGFIAGLSVLFSDRKRSMDVVMWIGGLLALLALILFFTNRSVTNGFYFAAEEPVSIFAGLAIFIGFVLVLVSRFLPRFFPWLVGFFAGGFILVALVGFIPIHINTVAWLIIFAVGAIVGLFLSLRFTTALSKNEAIVAAVTWGMIGNILGIAFAAISAIWINGYSVPTAVVGEFLPAAGPNLIFAAILVPLLVVAYASVQRQTGR